MKRYFFNGLKLFTLIFYVLMFLNLSAFSAKAFLFEIAILGKNEISKLSDEQLIAAYTEAVVEVQAVKTFFSKGGLTPRDYDNFKDVLRYRISLIQEMTKRGLDIPRTE